MTKKTIFHIYEGIRTLAGFLVGLGIGIGAAIRYKITDTTISNIFLYTGLIIIIVLLATRGNKYKDIIDSIKSIVRKFQEFIILNI